MNYGLPPAYSNATGTASQPLQQGASGSNTNAVEPSESKLNPQATAFVPHVQTAALPITDRQITVIHTPPFLQPGHKWGRKPYPPDTQARIDDAFKALKQERFKTAEAAFWVIINTDLHLLTRFEYQNLIVGFARSLKDQTHAKQEEARRYLEQLRLTEKPDPLKASTIHNLDLTLSLCEQSLGRYPDAEARLLRLRDKNPDDDRKTLCQTSCNFDVDIANARLWQFTGKYVLAQALLLNVKIELTKRLKSNQITYDVESLHKHLHTVNIALARLWQEMDCHDLALDLLLSMSNKNRDDSEETLCTSCGDIDTDLALARLWLLMGKTELAERLLLNMSGKRPDASEEELCKPSRHLETDLTLVRLWEEKGNYHLAERMLLNLSGKRPNASDEELCKPCKNRNVDLTRALLWKTLGKYELTERLLLNMSNKNPYQHEEVLCTPCGHYETDIALVRHWELMDKYELAERLLLNMIGKPLDASPEFLCRPCGHHVFDQTLALLWQTMGKYELTEILLLNLSGKRFISDEEILCTPCGNYWIDLAMARLWQVTGRLHWAERLLLNMIGKCPDDSEDQLCKLSGNYHIDITLMRIWLVTGKHTLTEKLLLNMSGKHHFNDQDCNDEDRLCEPCGNQEIDMALLRTWQARGKQKQAEILVERCYALYRSDEIKLTRLNVFVGQAKFMAMVAECPETPNTLLKTSIHYFTLACKQVTDGDTESGIANFNKSLELVDAILKQYPPSAAAYSHKAHCIRMLGGSEKKWRKLFNKADTLDTVRLERDKTAAWRINESDALKEMLRLRGKKVGEPK
ncbi:hypothetical protein [Endozoicomonas sp. 4G]|uniref:hypothetical protein n=1 Tax=Endozoicomonas sp. 4G TaxID=2872754 RepID=UPI0020784C2E|nr:hypothetical protein [Endozoicomonas sp. 4G]